MIDTVPKIEQNSKWTKNLKIFQILKKKIKIKTKLLKPLLKIYPEVQTDEQLVFCFVFFDSFVFFH